jgi:hypothetical protein
MRKERNNFFQESGYNQGYYYNNNNMIPQMPQMEASSSFYMNQNMNQNPSMYNDYQTRLARLERQVNRLESRINKLENNEVIKPNDDIEINSNMYMI